MDTRTLVNRVLLLVKKEVYGELRLADIETAFNAAQLGCSFLLAHDPGSSLINQHAVHPFKVAKPFPVVDGFCVIDAPDLHFGPITSGASAWMGCGDNPDKRMPVKWLNDEEWNDMTTSRIDPPDHAYPVARFRAPYGSTNATGSIQVAPSTLGMLEVIYWRKPKDIVIGHTIGPGGPVLDPSLPWNVDPEWPDIHMNRLIGATVRDLGMPLDDEAVKQFGSMLAKGVAP